MSKNKTNIKILAHIDVFIANVNVININSNVSLLLRKLVPQYVLFDRMRNAGVNLKILFSIGRCQDRDVFQPKSLPDNK